MSRQVGEPTRAEPSSPRPTAGGPYAPELPAAVPWPRRLALALACGLIAGGVTIQSNLTKAWPRDFGQVWFAARALLHGQDPYALIGPGRAYEWPGTFFYPLPAAIVAMPLAPFSEGMACTLFSIVGGACFAWALMRFGYGPLFGFFGAAAHFAFENAQWSPLLAASVVVPPLAFLLVCKPTIGVAMFAARPTGWAVAGGIILSGIAFLIEPSWLTHWREALKMADLGRGNGFPYRAPVTLPGGAVSLLCLLRWRRPEARLVLVLACVPQTLMLYESVPLWLVPRTFWESAVLVGLSYAAANYLGMSLAPGVGVPRYLAVSGQAMVLALYPAVTLMVLRRRNEGALPGWLERRISRWPAWVRGIPVRDRSESS